LKQCSGTVENSHETVKNIHNNVPIKILISKFSLPYITFK